MKLPIYQIFLSIVLMSVSSFVKAQWTLVWSDEFNYTGLPNSQLWEFKPGDENHNNEAHYYTDGRTENARVENGHLVIEARTENVGTRSFTSARLFSKSEWTYGKMEIRAKMPDGKGLWPAIWMLPRNDIYGWWPKSGEIDIMEHWGSRIWEPNAVFGTAHSSDFSHQTKNEKQGRVEVPDLTSTFNVYAIEWYEDQIRWLVNDEVFYTFHRLGGGNSAYPFNHPFHLILNLAVEGNTPPFPDWPKPTMEIDYVRVYQGPTRGPSIVAHPIPGKVEAEDFYDMKGVLNQNDASNGDRVVGYIDNEDWMDYRVNAENSGLYSVSFKVASPSGGLLQILSGSQVLGQVNISSTGDWEKWQINTVNKIDLPAGDSNLKIYAVNGGFNLDEMIFVRAGDSSNPTDPNEPQPKETVKLSGTCNASSQESSGLAASKACDGDTATRWSSGFSNNQWISVDLGQEKTVRSVKLLWEAAYASAYRVQISENGKDWTTVHAENNGNGGEDNFSLDPVTARYVRMQGVKRATRWGYSLFEFEVYGESDDSSTGNNQNPGSQPTGNGISATLVKTADWGNGYCADVHVKNQGSSTQVWQVSIPIQGRIDSSWNGNFTQVGSTLNISGTWNGSIKPGETITTPGFCAAR